MTAIAPCPNCEGSNLYRSTEVSAGGGHTRFFARPSAMAKLSESSKWTRI